MPPDPRDDARPALDSRVPFHLAPPEMMPNGPRAPGVAISAMDQIADLCRQLNDERAAHADTRRELAFEKQQSLDLHSAGCETAEMLAAERKRRERAEMLHGYVMHKEDCAANSEDGDEPCDCGLDKVIAAWLAAKAESPK